MQGIAGIIANSCGESYKEKLKSMLRCINKEPFHPDHFYFDENDGFYFGLTGSKKDSISNYDLSVDHSSMCCSLLLGEIFPNKNTHSYKIWQGNDEIVDYNFVFLNLYLELGNKSFKDLNGWFSGVIIDKKNKKCILVNDRYGMQRIYFYRNKDEFVFSSSAKSILKIYPELREFDSNGLSEYAVCGTTLFNKSLFKGIAILPGGSAWEFKKNQSVKKNYYFKPAEWENLQHLEKDKYYSQFRNTFRNILPRYFRPDTKVAMSLTGGLDTRMILSNINFPSFKLPCYTYSGIYRDCYDAIVAKKVAKELKQNHYTLRMGRDFIKNFSIYAEDTIFSTDGYLDVRNAFEIYFSKIAREIAPIRITGNYGSEIVRSVDYLTASFPNEELFQKDFISSLHEALETYHQARNVHPQTYIAFRLIPWYMYGRIAAAQNHLTLRTPYMDNELVELVYQAPNEILRSRELSLQLIADGNPELAMIPTDRGLSNNKGLIKSKSIRLYYEALFKAEYIFNEGMPGWLARLNGFIKPIPLEKLFLGRHKIDFPRIWFRDQLSDYVKNIILDPKSIERPYLNGPFLEIMIQRHLKGSHNYTREINLVLTLELIQRKLFENL